LNEKDNLCTPSISAVNNSTGSLTLLSLSVEFCDVEEMLAERGIDVSYETIRGWVLKFGPAIAANVKSRRVQPSGTWHLDEVLSALVASEHICGAQLTMKARFSRSWRSRVGTSVRPLNLCGNY
jgi:hypothetical protein